MADAAGTTFYSLHGLTIASELDLYQRQQSRETSPDVHIRTGSTIAELELPHGELLTSRDDRRCRIVRTRSEYAVQLYQYGDFRIDLELRQITANVTPGRGTALAPVLLTGQVLGSLLTLRDEYVLHASAVEIDGAAVAVVGSTGMGKSTLTAALCLAGANLVSDDTLRVTVDGEASCFRGSSLLRLRRTSSALVARFPKDIVFETPDGRFGVRPDMTRRAKTPVAAIVVPRLDARARDVSVSPLAAPELGTTLLRNPRVASWTRARELQLILHRSAQVAAMVPAYEVRIPFGREAAVPEAAEEVWRHVT